MIIHQFISGYTQNVNTLHGILKLSERLSSTGLIDGVNNRIALNLWNCNWKKVAEYYWILSEYYTQPITLCVYAYSWGAGWGAIQLAKHLGRAGLEVRVMVLCDPVYRHPKWYLRWLALVRKDATLSPIIRVPENVEEVYSLHQTTNRPMGHRLLPTNGTIIHPSYLVKNTVHQKMDDCWKFHALVLEVAKRVSKNQQLGSIQIDRLKLIDYLKP